MNLAQSPYVPMSGTRPGLRDMAWLAVFAARGFVELVRARIIFASLEAKAIPERNKKARSSASLASNCTTGVSEKDLARIAYVIPRLSDRLPWRSDCVIQAIAGQNWLSSIGASSEIQIGVENPQDGKFGAHAWLLHGESVVTGGDITRYDLILSSSHDQSDPQPKT